MGTEAEAWKQRLCKVCGNVMYCSASELKVHADQCQRMKRIGLVLPGEIIALKELAP